MIKLTNQQTARAERNRAIFNRALALIGESLKMSRAEVLALLADDAHWDDLDETTSKFRGGVPG